MLQSLLNNGQAIQVNTAISTKEYEEQKTVMELYNEALDDVSTIVEAKSKPICHIPCSFGKDSLLVLLITIMAYAKLINLGRIEKNRPLIVTTVDTAVEAVPMQMMVRYCAPRVEAFAKSLGVNLQFSLLKPRFTDEFFIRWGSAQKIVPNPTKSGDCSVILKLDVSERHLRGLSAELADQGYSSSPICSLLGSRDAESQRRSRNIEKANLRTNPLAAMNAVELSRGTVIYQYAPVNYWSDEQVFLFHELAGTSPVVKSLLGNNQPLFDSFLPNHGLTLAIYGNGKNEACQVVAGQKNNATCGGKSARFGCYICPMTGSIDRSSEALADYPRWRVLGGDKALAVRDWLFRLSTKMHARAFHAKAIDEVGFNRVALQPNVLKARYLEKMVWYASMLSVESEQKAAEFRELVAQGREMEHEGMQDIASDTTLSADVKRQFLDMYRETAQSPMYECFSERHALLLSFRWLIDGVATTSFKPISIYQRVLNGERLPTPITNREFEAKFGKISMSNNLPDAVMIPFHTESFEEGFNPVKSPRILSYWQRPYGVLDLFDKETNCTIENKPSNSMKLDVTASCKIKDDGTYVPSFEKPKMNGRLVPKLVEEMIDADISKLLEQHYENRANEMFDEPFDTIKSDFSQKKTVSLAVPFLTQKEIGLQTTDSQAKTKKYNEKTERVIKRKGGKILRTTTRMNFYPPKAVPALLANKLVSVNSLALDFSQEEQFVLSLRDEESWQEEADTALDNLTINERTFTRWLSIGGWEKALNTHDKELSNRLLAAKSQRGNGWVSRQVRVYGGSGNAHDLLRTSGIEIAPKYVPQLRNTLKRTDLFDQIGIYDYAALSHEQLLAMSNTISMAQHRKDKVKCVQAIRNHRNKMRHLHKAIQFRDGAPLFERHFEHAHDALVEVEKGLFHVLGGHIDTAEPSTPQRLAASRMFLGINSVSLTNLESCMKVLFSSASVANMKANPRTMISLVNTYRSELGALQNTISCMTSEWNIKCSALSALVNNLKASEEIDHNSLWLEFQEQHNQFAKAQVTYYPYWNASRTQKIVAIEKKIELLSKVLDELARLAQLIQKSIATSGSNTVKSLSTKDKLNFLAVVA